MQATYLFLVAVCWVESGGGVDALSGTASTIYAMPCKHMNKNVYCINYIKKLNSKKSWSNLSA